MAVTELYAGTESVSTTEWSLTTDTSYVGDAATDDGAIQTWVDLSAMVRGDEFILRCYEKVRSIDAQKLVFAHSIRNQQSDPLYVTPALLLMHGWDFTLDQISGSARTVTWGIRALGGTPTESSEGSATIGSVNEYFIQSESTTKTKQTTAGIYQLWLDLSNLAKNDVFEVKVTEEARAADTVEQIAYRSELWGVKTSKAWVSPALALMNGWEFGIIKKAGTDRAIPYSLRKLA